MAKKEEKTGKGPERAFVGFHTSQRARDALASIAKRRHQSMAGLLGEITDDFLMKQRWGKK